MTRSCSDCGKHLRRDNQSGRCKSCCDKARTKPRGSCLDCGKTLSLKNVTGRCKRCCIRHIGIEARKDPVKMERIREASRALGNFAKYRSRQIEVHKANAARRRRDRLASVPPEWRREFGRLMDHRGITEARVIIAERIAKQREERAARLASMSPFERQMEALKNGARLIEKPVLKQKDYDFSLHGGSLG